MMKNLHKSITFDEILFPVNVLIYGVFRVGAKHSWKDASELI